MIERDLTIGDRVMLYPPRKRDRGGEVVEIRGMRVRWDAGMTTWSPLSGLCAEVPV